jgi:SAM-dependent methyltransferase
MNLSPTDRPSPPTLSRLDWSRGTPSELAFWDRWLAGKTPHEEGRRRRLDPTTPLQWWICDELPETQKQVRILDVGSGPVTTLGSQWPGHEVEIVAVDPLADDYNELLRRHNLTPPVRTQACFGEDLRELFPPESFDFVHACNSLDHSRDPFRCYQQMLEVLKPGCTLITFHMKNEGASQNYEGLHQWNFEADAEAGPVVLRVWNETGSWNLFDRLEGWKDASIRVEGAYIRLRMVKDHPAAV